MEIDDLEFLGELREVLPGKTYEEKVSNFFNYIDLAHERGYALCDLRDCKIIINAAWALLRDGTPLASRVKDAEEKLRHISSRKNTEVRTIQQLVEEYQD